MRKEHEHGHVGVIEKHTLKSVDMITLMKHKHKYVTLVMSSTCMNGTKKT